MQINFTEKESQLQKIFLKSAIGFFYKSQMENLKKVVEHATEEGIKVEAVILK